MFPNNHDSNQPVQPVNTEPVPQQPVFSPTPMQDITPPQSQLQPKPVVQPSLSTESLQPADQPTPSVQPAPSNTPAITINDDVPSDKPKSKKKKGLIIGIIIAVVVVVGLAVAALWYFLIYNDPNNAVADAFTKALTAKSGTLDATLSANSRKVGAMKVSYNESKQVADINFGSSSNQKLVLNLASDGGNLYFKINNLQKLSLEAMASGLNASTDSSTVATIMALGTLASKANDKWITITSNDLRMMGDGRGASISATECIAKQIASFRNDSAISGELKNVYVASPLLIVTAKGGDASGNEYELKAASKKTIVAFLTALQDTKIFKGLNSCSNGQLTSGVRNSIKNVSEPSDSKMTIDVWIDGWSHTLNEVKLADSSTGKTQFVVATKFNTNPAVTIPKSQLTFDSLMSEFAQQAESTSPNQSADTTASGD